MKMPWFIRETAGAVLLLGVIIYLPVVVSDYTAPETMPFEPEANRRQWIKLFPSNPETLQAIMATVGGQLKAIRNQQFDAAFQFASKGIQEEQPLDEFEEMVRTHYRPMLDYEAIEISNSLDDGKQGMIRVRLSRNRIPTAVYSYVMALEEGQWKIGGVLADGPPTQPDSSQGESQPSGLN